MAALLRRGARGVSQLPKLAGEPLIQTLVLVLGHNLSGFAGLSREVSLPGRSQVVG
jgi:hypothetical protein